MARGLGRLCVREQASRPHPALTGSCCGRLCRVSCLATHLRPRITAFHFRSHPRLLQVDQVRGLVGGRDGLVEGCMDGTVCALPALVPTGSCAFLTVAALPQLFCRWVSYLNYTYAARE